MGNQARPVFSRIELDLVRNLLQLGMGCLNLASLVSKGRQQKRPRKPRRDREVRCELCGKSGTAISYCSLIRRDARANCVGARLAFPQDHPLGDYDGRELRLEEVREAVQLRFGLLVSRR